MNENIDLTKILKDCPKGWKFWSPFVGEVEFQCIFQTNVFVNAKNDGKTWSFSADATFPLGDIKSPEIMLYPSKDQRDWSKFAAPWLEKQVDSLRVNDRAWLYLVSDVLTWKCGVGQYIDNPRVQELAKRLCSEYAQKLYDPSVLSNSSNTGKNEQKSADKVEPKFKVGDKIRHKYNHNVCFTITDIEEDYYVCGASLSFCFANQDQYELIPNKQPKFDPKTLEPFDKILVRDSDEHQWKCTLYSHQRGESVLCKYVTMGASYEYCIPYNDDTKHLVGTTEEAPEFYRYWED